MFIYFGDYSVNEVEVNLFFLSNSCLPKLDKAKLVIQSLFETFINCYNNSVSFKQQILRSLTP